MGVLAQKDNDKAVNERILAKESFSVPTDFIYSKEKFMMAIGGPQKIRLQNTEGYFIEIQEGVGKYSLSPASSTRDFVTGDINNSFGLYIIGNYLYYIDGNAISKKNL